MFLFQLCVHVSHIEFRARGSRRRKVLSKRFFSLDLRTAPPMPRISACGAFCQRAAHGCPVLLQKKHPPRKRARVPRREFPGFLRIAGKKRRPRHVGRVSGQTPFDADSHVSASMRVRRLLRRCTTDLWNLRASRRFPTIVSWRTGTCRERAKRVEGRENILASASPRTLASPRQHQRPTGRADQSAPRPSHCFTHIRERPC